jgi:FAD/FMN-containing dehydrogenase
VHPDPDPQLSEPPRAIQDPAPAGRPRTNWAGNIAFSAPGFHRPATLGELRAVVAGARQLRVVATGHSFNDMADSPGAQVSLAGLPPEVEVDRAASRVRVAAGLSYAALAARLDRQGFALHNLASLPHISVAGACATGTHGSGLRNQSLAAAVSAVEFVTADGDLAELSRDSAPDAFPGAVVHLGALGVVTRLVLEIMPSFDVSQRVYEDLPLEVLDDHFAGVMAAGYQSQKSHGSPHAPLPPRATRSPACRRTTAPGNWGCPARGSSGCRTSGPSSPRARVTNCSRSTCFRPAARCPRPGGVCEQRGC